MEKKLTKKTNVKYDVNTDKEIVDYIIKNPGNIQKACRELSIKLNRTPNAISIRWYFLSKKNKLNKSFILVGKNKHYNNRKNTEDTIKHKISLWKKIINLINKKLK